MQPDVRGVSIGLRTRIMVKEQGLRVKYSLIAVQRCFSVPDVKGLNLNRLAANRNPIL